MDIISAQLLKGGLTMCAASIRLFLAHVEAERLVTSDLATHDRPYQILRTVSRDIRRFSSFISLLGLILERIGEDLHELSSSISHLGFLFLPYASCRESNIEGLILGLHCPTCGHCISSSNIGKIRFAVTKSFNDHSKLIEMEFRPELSRDVFDANRVNEGDTVPYIKEREAVNAKISQVRGTFVLNFRRYGKLGKSLSPVDLGFSRVVSSTSKDGKGVLKRLDCRSCGEIIRVCDVDKEGKDFFDSSAYQVISMDGFGENAGPCFKP